MPNLAEETDEERVERMERERIEAERLQQQQRDAAAVQTKLTNVKARCPLFSEDCHYPTFKTTCEAYLALHDVPRSKQGLVLAMNALPDSGANNIKQRYFDEHKIAEMNCDAGLDMFWKFLDEIYEQDPLMEMCSKLKDLMHYKRQNDTPVKDYISEFDARYQRAIAKKVPKLPDELLMWLLLEGSGIAEHEKRLVMVEVDLKDSANIFKNTKNSMKKLFSGLLSGESESPKVISDAFYAGGARGGFGANRGFRGRGSFGGFGGFGPNRGRGRGGFGNQRFQSRGAFGQQRFPPPGTASGGGQASQPGQQKNPPLNGQPRFCHQCGSENHFMAACPEKHGWPAFYAGMCQVQQLWEESDGDHYGYDGWQGDQGDHHHQQDYGAAPPGQDYPSQTFHQVQTSDQKEENLIAEAASLHLGDNPDQKSYYTQYTIFLTRKLTPSIREAIDLIHLDTACVKTCCGEEWANYNLDRMSDDVRKLVRFIPSTSVIRFGEGDPQPSKGTLILPISIAGQNLFLHTEVVKTNIPCLLSNEAMERVGMIINLKNQTASFRGETVPIIKVKSGHSCVQFGNFDLREKDEYYAMVTLDESKRYDYKTLLKIHDVLGHPSKSTMEKMFDIAEREEKEDLQKVYDKCATCLIHRRSKPRPKVSPPLAHNFNDVVSMDLKIDHAHNTIRLYLVDVFSKYMAGYLVKNKEPETIIKPFLESWILTRFGAPRAILSDCGGEFVNSKMKSLCESFNIKMYTTAGYSAHQNGVNERHHATCDEIIKKMMSSGRFKSVRDAIGPAVFAKNIRVMSNGYSPHQIVFGTNPRVPGALENDPPAQSGRSELALIQDRLQSLFNARKELSKLDNAHRLETASKVTHSGKMVFVDQGEDVYYRMGLDPDWHGPGKVIGQDGKQIFIRHGRSYIIASPARIWPVKRNPEYQQISTKADGSSQSNALTPPPSLYPPTPPDSPPLISVPTRQTRSQTRSQTGKPDKSRHESLSSDEEEFPPANYHINAGTAAQVHTNDITASPRYIQSPPHYNSTPTSPNSPTNSTPPFISPVSSSPPTTNSPTDSFSTPSLPRLGPIHPTTTTTNTQLDTSPVLKQNSTEKDSNSQSPKERGMKRQSEEEAAPPTPPTNNQTLNSGRRLMKKVKKWPSSPSGYKYQNERVYPKRGQRIYIHDPENGENAWHRVMVMERTTQGKSSPFGPSFNIDFNNKKQNIYLNHFDWHFEGAGYQTPETVKEDIRNFIGFQDGYIEADLIFEDEEEQEEGIIREKNDPDIPFKSYVTFVPTSEHGSDEVKAAKTKELNHFKDYGVYQEVPDQGQERITSAWVVTRKEIDGKPGIKARLICHGSQNKLTQGNPQKIDSPTVKRTSIKMLMTLAAQYGWEVKCQDVTSAFLQSKKLVRNIYVQPPKEMGYEEAILWLLIRPMYGLDEASFLWYETLRDSLINKGGKKVMSDPAFFYFHKDGVLIGVIALWVDDVFSAGNDEFQETVMKTLTEEFKFGAFHSGDFKVLGMNIIHRGPDIYLSQNDYIKAKVQYVNIQIPDGDTPNAEIPEQEKKKVYEAVGKIRWVSDQTRPDLAFEELEMSISQRKATHKDVKKLNKMIKTTMDGTFWIKYSKIPGHRWFLSVFVDASLGNLPGRMDSAYGYAIFLSQGYNPSEKRAACILDWHCSKIDRVTTSTYEAEAIALKHATEVTINLKETLHEVTNIPKKLIDIQVFCDNHHVVSSIFSTKDTCKSPMVIKDIGRMKQIVDRSDITSLSWIPTEQQIADCFTKSTASRVPIRTILSSGNFFY